MMNVPRTGVLWFGSKDVSEFKERLNALAHLELIEVGNEQQLLKGLSIARAVVFEFDGDTGMYIARIRRTNNLALENGVLIVLINGNGVDPTVFEVVANRAFRLVPEPYGPEYAQFQPIREFQRDLCRAAHEIAVWQPGPTSNSSVKIRGKYDLQDAHLLKRAFSDFPCIEVRTLPEGKSGARVYSVVSQKEPQPLFLAKVDATDRIAGEVDRYFKYVCKTVSFNNRPNVDTERTVYTPHLSVLVEDFLEKAKPLYEVLPHSTPAVLVSSIFEGAFRNWRRDAKSEKRKLSEDGGHLEYILTRKKQAFFDAGEHAKKYMNSPYDAEELLAACNAIEPLSCTWSRIHGDLHAGNIYVGTGSSEVILLDFTKTDVGPAVLDPACLEVDVVFNRTKANSYRLARRLYRSPLKLPATSATMRSSQAWLLDTVRAIRRFGLTDLDRRAYTFAVSCYLIRYASFKDSGTAKKRAAAACIASHLIEHLTHEKEK